ncbi:hypothetical protein MES5069_760020 [Mesorhizobium escarrei]|uniref:Uncharacterized protein n=1 Tax=Mesorhizobium escarrei TaxID=666018 RepID=A0ABM9EJS6_9HYPH|nr:hypothetical protein MES5069_760020 [Mesorhizobium escarrei]
MRGCKPRNLFDLPHEFDRPGIPTAALLTGRKDKTVARPRNHFCHSTITVSV